MAVDVKFYERQLESISTEAAKLLQASRTPGSAGTIRAGLRRIIQKSDGLRVALSDKEEVA